MPTECTAPKFTGQARGGREVVARFDGGALTSDGGAVLLGEVERATGIVRQFAACFTDHRDPARIEHPVAQLVAQRVFGLALGYEDLNDHDQLRADPLLAVLVGSADPAGQARRGARDVGKPLAGGESQDSCRMRCYCRSARAAPSCGLSQTVSTGDQSRVGPLQRAGCRAFAAA